MKFQNFAKIEKYLGALFSGTIERNKDETSSLRHSTPFCWGDFKIKTLTDVSVRSIHKSKPPSLSNL